MAWAESRAAREPEPGWWGIDLALFEALGETLPTWPLEWCAAQVDGLNTFQDGIQTGLRPWSAALLDLADCRRELNAELQLLSLPRMPHSALQAETARLGPDWQADWCIEISWESCQGLCQDQARSGILRGVNLPAGLLEVHAGSADRLALAGLGLGRAAYTYQLAPGAKDAFRASLAKALGASPRLLKQPQPLRPTCCCWPRLSQQARWLRLTLPAPTLLPENLLIQSGAWLAAQAMGRWLGEELQILDQLGADLDSYLQKVAAVLPAQLKSQTFLQIRR
ncbi:MAG: hypothetical protein CVV27_19280 [Candidatus Melainabacteria bacterium HGW-Melainabacteria-1]|nr:MAG: hypothetical protein CVV27_19280 [Candidatus Melainabacteria bacterium HGW-Melainabacteria-1]